MCGGRAWAHVRRRVGVVCVWGACMGTCAVCAYCWVQEGERSGGGVCVCACIQPRQLSAQPQSADFAFCRFPDDALKFVI